MYSYKIHIFVDAYDIIIKYDKSHYIYISNYLIKQFKNIIMLLITFLWSFSYIFINFDQFYVYRYFFSKISADISVISNVLSLPPSNGSLVAEFFIAKSMEMQPWIETTSGLWLHACVHVLSSSSFGSIVFGLHVF